jgi:hypothetical protein
MRFRTGPPSLVLEILEGYQVLPCAGDAEEDIQELVFLEAS